MTSLLEVLYIRSVPRYFTFEAGFAVYCQIVAEAT